MILLVYLVILYSSILILTLLIIFTFLLVRKYLEQRTANNRKASKDKIYRLLTQYITGNEIYQSRYFQTREKWKVQQIIECLHDLSVLLSSEEERRKIGELCEQVGINLIIEKELKDKRWWIVAEATRKAGRLRLKNLTPFIRDNLRHSKYEVWSTSAMVLSSIEPDTLLTYVMVNEGQSQKKMIRILSFLLSKDSNPSHQIVLEGMEKVTPPVRRMFIKILATYPYPEVINFLESELLSEDTEIRIAALSSLGSIGITTEEDAILNILENGTWAEKVMAAKTARQCGLRKSIPKLVHLLSHPEWWVRFRCAEALYDFGQEGKQELLHCIEHHEDPYSRDMARKILKEKETEGRIL